MLEIKLVQKRVVHEVPHSGVERKPFFEGKLYYPERSILK